MGFGANSVTPTGWRIHQKGWAWAIILCPKSVHSSVFKLLINYTWQVCPYINRSIQYYYYFTRVSAAYIITYMVR